MLRPASSIVPAVLVTALLLLAPYAAALPTPGVNCDLSRGAGGRLFPEAMETNDFISFREAECGFAILLNEHPDRMRVHEAAQSAGWTNRVTGARDTFPVYVVEVSNFASAISTADKHKLVFQLSIHGNEKGGREGGLRVIEDFVSGIGHAEKYPELVKMLDYMMLVFVFPNPDGWVHEEPEYRANDACYSSATCPYGGQAGNPGAETQHFVRVNGNGKDLNRQWPTIGWNYEPYETLKEPEPNGLVRWLMNYTRVAYATDIHGMLNPADGTTGETGTPIDPVVGPIIGGGPASEKPRGHYVLTMLPAGRQSPEEMLKTTALADLIKQRLNADPYFAEWQSVPESTSAWGGEFNDWGTVWDTLSYTDSGFTSDWYAQDHGLNAPGVDFELAYNHITFDNYYPGVAQRMNDYHVHAVREIVRAFMEHASKDVQLSIETGGKRTAFLTNPKVITNAGKMSVGGWAQKNPNDDRFDSAHRVWEAAPNDYFTDLQPFLRDGTKPGVLDALRPGDFNAQKLAGYDNLVIAGSAYEEIQGNAQAIAALKAWAEKGGTLFVTDAAMPLLTDLGVTPDGAVKKFLGYAGYANFVARDSPLLEGVRGLARQTYEPVPLGYGVDGQNAPIWYVAADKFKGTTLGVGGKDQSGSLDTTKVVFGQTDLGSGRVVFLGAFLPDPSTEFYHPYGVDGYATTYSGNQIFRNVLGWKETFERPPVLSPDTGELRPVGNTAGAGGRGASGNTADSKTPAPGAALLVVSLLALAAIVGRRRDRPGA